MKNQDIIRALKNETFHESLDQEQVSHLPNISVRALSKEQLEAVTGGASHARPLTGFGMNARPLTGIDMNASSQYKKRLTGFY